MLLPRVEIEESGNNEQHQDLHEDEKAGNKSTILKVCVGVSEKRSQDYSCRQPRNLPFAIPHDVELRLRGRVYGNQRLLQQAR